MMITELDHIKPTNNNYYSRLVHGQKIALISSFTLESGKSLRSVPIAYKTWGSLNQQRNNVLILCHALSGSSDAEDWWRPLMGHGKALDYAKFFIFCANVLGSPYGSASPLTTNPETGECYGPEFPETTIRDDVRYEINFLLQFSTEILQNSKTYPRCPRRTTSCCRNRRIYGWYGRG